MGVGVSTFSEKRCTVQRYLRYEEVGGGQISRKKALRNTRMAPNKRVFNGYAYIACMINTQQSYWLPW